MLVHRTIILTAAFACASPALAQDASATKPGTEAGAEKLRADLAQVISPQAFDKGYVTVEPDASGYRVTVAIDTTYSVASGSDDATKPADGAAEPLAFTADVTIPAWSFHISEQADGNWLVESKDPMSFSYGLAYGGRDSSIDYDLGAIDFSGVYSPALATFRSLSGTVGKTEMRQTDVSGEVTATTGPQTFDMTATEAGQGAVDFVYSQTVEDFSEHMDMAVDPTNPDQTVPIVLKAASLDAEGSGKALKSRAVLDVYSFVLAHAAKEDLQASQDELKDKLRALLPLWDTMDGTFAFNGMDVETPAGQFSVDKAYGRLVADGIETAGRYTYTLGAEGFATSSDQVPPWALSLIPSDLELALSLDDTDLDTPVRLAIEDFDLNRSSPLSEDAKAQIEALFRDTPPHVIIEPSRIVGQDYRISVSGEIGFSDATPQATVDVRAEGLDAVMTSLQQAGPDNQQAFQALGFVSMAKGFAETQQDGSVRWLIEAAPDGSVKLNGVMLKGPTAPADALPGEDVEDQLKN
ncbi:DUF2125 domain-containing protein [Consotaella aegiceratis]|uniref:DUF2125 domain-containing protein n=1 Tax=Consotaella aegiceratis TaxID=3097961 RepID=UPI002F3E9895